MNLEDEDGNFYMTDYLGGTAFAFEGNDDFLKRCRNFISNYGLAGDNGAVITDSFMYIVTTAEKLKKALQTYYYGLIILNGEVKPAPVIDEEGDEIGYEWDEELMEQIASQKCENFLERRVVKSNFITESGCILRPQQLAPM